MIATNPGSTNKRPGNEAAMRAMQQPADVHRELLRFRSRQQHAVVQRMQEPIFADPALLVDQNAVHHRDLPGRPAEAEGGDLRPDADRLAKRNPMHVRHRHAVPDRRPPAMTGVPPRA